MKIDGKAIAQDIVNDLRQQVSDLAKQGITPHLAVILIGDDESSKAYVRQKELKAEEIGAKISIFRYSSTLTEEELLNRINALNSDPTVHGIIIQRPLPPHINGDRVTESTALQKDIDGFCHNSPFDPPIARAVMQILEEAFTSSHPGGIRQKAETDRIFVERDSIASSVMQTSLQNDNFFQWLANQKIVVIGKGQTAGKPTINFFQKHSIPVTVISSKTENKDDILRNADIIISAVGIPHIIKEDVIKDGVILLGVGMHRGEDGKLHGDYKAADIAEKAAFYTTTPGGVGPINVAMLLDNLVLAAKRKNL